jgi:hypothetical protein
MSLGFDVTKVLHRINVCFVKAVLPTFKGKFHLRPVQQQTLNIHDVASKADIYKIHTSPETIEEGANAFFALVCHLVAEGYRIETPVFKLTAKIPGVYSGNEDRLPAGVFPELHLTASRQAKDYVKKYSEIALVAKISPRSVIESVFDHGSETSDECITRGHNITITGRGLKIIANPDSRAETGVFFEAPDGNLVKASMPPANEPKRLVVLVPQGLEEGAKYHICLKTMTGTTQPDLISVRSEQSYRVAA